MAKKVLIVDDSFMMREIIKDIVSTDHGFTVVGEAENGRDCLDKVKTLVPDLMHPLILDGRKGLCYISNIPQHI